jgi:hypothetical protein
VPSQPTDPKQPTRPIIGRVPRQQSPRYLVWPQPKSPLSGSARRAGRSPPFVRREVPRLRFDEPCMSPRRASPDCGTGRSARSPGLTRKRARATHWRGARREFRNLQFRASAASRPAAISS